MRCVVTDRHEAWTCTRYMCHLDTTHEDLCRDVKFSGVTEVLMQTDLCPYQTYAMLSRAPMLQTSPRTSVCVSNFLSRRETTRRCSHTRTCTYRECADTSSVVPYSDSNVQVRVPKADPTTQLPAHWQKKSRLRTNSPATRKLDKTVELPLSISHPVSVWCKLLLSVLSC